ncbi:hypothetical protein AVEN_211487-1 [Araneus ventricosus]|uniref:Uncharacterized protein n=1 Tax=Araneus ventricosus TaxID=182803 RepID=A0A4Y2N1C7_ARAVE|nr:hypothetical protein AVEN_211487-1 [Araneus ventricosus]
MSRSFSYTSLNYFFYFRLLRDILETFLLNILEQSAVNFRATDYVDLFDWQTFYVTPPPVLRQISSPELLKMIHDDVPMDGWDFIKFPSHSQAVERIMKLVTDSSRKRSWTAEQGLE